MGGWVGGVYEEWGERFRWGSVYICGFVFFVLGNDFCYVGWDYGMGDGVCGEFLGFDCGGCGL